MSRLQRVQVNEEAERLGLWWQECELRARLMFSMVKRCGIMKFKQRTIGAEWCAKEYVSWSRMEVKMVDHAERAKGVRVSRRLKDLSH